MTMRSPRCSGLVLMLLLTAPLVAGDKHAAPVVLVVASVEVEAHRSAIEGIRAVVTASSAEVRVLDASQANGEGSGGQLFAPSVRVIIAVGSEATRVVESERPDVPVICAMVMRRRPEPEAKVRRSPVTIPLDVSLHSLLAQLKQLFPGKSRLGLILNPSWSGINTAQLQARAQQLGFTLHTVECSEAGQLLAAMASLKNHVDFVWCLPDGALYNSTTIKPLILASIENRLPLIGFSESFAKAGAAIGIYPDFRDVGAQAGEAARQLIEGQTVHPPEGPRRLKVALNQSVLRLFGLRYARGSEGAEVSLLP